MNQELIYGITFIVIIIITFVVAKLFQRTFNRFIQSNSPLVQSHTTNYKFLKHFISGAIYLVGIALAIYSVPNLKSMAGSLLAGAGIAAVAIGFASQQALSNVIGGVFIIIFKPFKINDRLVIGTYMGIVEDITLRHTVIRDFENRRIVMPNSIISEEVLVNADFAEEKICKWIDVGITYDSDIDLAKSIMADEVLNHPLQIDNRTQEQIDNGDPEVPVRLVALADSSINLRAWAWTNNSADAFLLNCDLLESIKKRFDREGVNIAFPHRVVIMKNEEEMPAIVVNQPNN